MLSPQIRCYHNNATLQPHVFYILSKGNNAGKPSFKPWANCFSVSVQNQKYFDFYFWLAYGLWQAGKFQPYYRGSVIQFITVKDLRSKIMQVAPAIYMHWQQYQQIISSLSKLEQKKSSLAQQIIATEKLQHYLIQAYFKNK